ncbi:DUF99 family protein [Halobellus sp. H-GB7]|uniref:endonuclease dU n=1 Tax=Halobellus sp. H-GB7 TaxID=3069756 RepID=UPI0027B3202F|nr:DUF99 family protein [Halobellus sp. H-GB7]MDQ2055789.1 DUF99 family protein [Halobellus sp. H-GB7]
MKPGTRALGIAESTDETSGRCTFCGAVVRADRAVDGFAFATATVGGLDATDAVCTLLDRLDRPDVQYLLVSGVAPAWFNLLDLDRIATAADRPVLSVSYEDSPGLEPALREQLDGDALDSRLAIYDRLPARRRLRVNDETVFVRGVGVDDDEAARVVRAYTPAGGRPEPVRVARLAARGARAWRADDADC